MALWLLSLLLLAVVADRKIVHALVHTRGRLVVLWLGGGAGRGVDGVLVCTAGVTTTPT